MTTDTDKLNSTGLQPIIKWPGGKEKELKYIIPNLPKFRRFFEPFVGGGSVYVSIRADEYYINDFSSELISLYKNIANTDEMFFKYVEMIDKSWINSVELLREKEEIIDIYKEFSRGIITKHKLKEYIRDFCKKNESNILEIIDKELIQYQSALIKEVEKNLLRKMTRMNELEHLKNKLPDQDIYDNIVSAIKSAIYIEYREMYNNKSIELNNKSLFSALFFFIRNYSYSGMFRYSKKGEFNVPYGGIAYNNKLMSKKLRYYKSDELLNHFTNTKIYNLDFEKFLRITEPNTEDFIFLDPPYDSEFSTYAQHEFTRADQERLANYLINECAAKWMMIIKNTDFIYSLYDKENINIRTFDKEYLVSFMNRNEKKVTHLLITNY